MEVKTIVSARSEGPDAFDKQINKALAEGFQLVKRGMLPAVVGAGYNYRPQYYAELVKPDELAKKDDDLDVFEHLEAVARFCKTRPNCDGCPLDEFCKLHLPREDGPADWLLTREDLE